MKLADDSPLSIYVNRDEESFNKVMNLPINKLTEEKVHLISLKDEKSVITMHNQLTQTVANAKNWSVEDTTNIINSLSNPFFLTCTPTPIIIIVCFFSRVFHRIYWYSSFFKILQIFWMCCI